MTSEEAAWFAGILDGEGALMICRDKNPGDRPTWVATVAVKSTDERIIRRCRELAGGYSRPTPPSPNCRDAWLWTLRGPSVGPALETARPYLVIKREQAALLLRLRREVHRGGVPGQQGVRLCPARNARRELLCLAVKALNHRGRSPIPAERLAALARVRALGWTSEEPCDVGPAPLDIEDDCVQEAFDFGVAA